MKRRRWTRDEVALVSFVWVVALALVGVAIALVTNGGVV